MKPNRTPGLWSYDEEYGKVLDASGRNISVSGVSIPCGYVPRDDESHANARMLAAAPEMLAALEEVLELLPYAGRLHPRDLSALMFKVTGAIKNAKGDL